MDSLLRTIINSLVRHVTYRLSKKTGVFVLIFIVAILLFAKSAFATTTIPVTTTITATTVVQECRTATSLANITERALCEMSVQLDKQRSELLLGMVSVIFLLSIVVGLKIWR